MEPPDEYCLSSDCFADQGIEIVPGEKSNSEWLVLNDLYIFYPYFKNILYTSETTSLNSKFEI